MPRLRIALLLALLWLSPVAAEEIKPGFARWPIKTSISMSIPEHDIELSALLALLDPPGARHSNPAHQSTLYPRGENALGLGEGDIVTIRGWLHLVGREPDGDYHIQISASPTTGDHCLIVEVPLDDARFVASPDLRRAARLVRGFIRTQLLRGKQPSQNGSVMITPAFVEVTGQLFFDDPHVGMDPRGKKNMKAASLWELHPVTAIRFAPTRK